MKTVYTNKTMYTQSSALICSDILQICFYSTSDRNLHIFWTVSVWKTAFPMAFLYSQSCSCLHLNWSLTLTSWEAAWDSKYMQLEICVRISIIWNSSNGIQLENKQLQTPHHQFLFHHFQQGKLWMHFSCAQIHKYFLHLTIY